jgi:uncharacterized protein YdeI (YjbR/CyaY-like superfamily)
MEVKNKLELKDIKSWRRWLEKKALTTKEAWLVLNYDNNISLDYLEAVEEALCFGCIDSTAKRVNDQRIQRFSPRRKNSNWTELNKERVRRLIGLGKMSEEGYKTLPNLDISLFKINKDVMNAIRKDKEVLSNFNKFPELYKRVRISYIQEYEPGTEEFNKRLSNLINKTKENKLFGNWNDNGKLSGKY